MEKVEVYSIFIKSISIYRTENYTVFQKQHPQGLCINSQNSGFIHNGLIIAKKINIDNVIM